MGEYDYLNARVRAMGAQLLHNEFFEQILSLDSEDLPMDALLASSYGPVLREALTEQAGITAIEWALRRDLASSFSRVRAMAPPGARALLDTQFARWDLQNILAVLRGIEARARPREISSALLPAGAFPEAQLAELARSPDPVSLARKLATWNYLFAFELHDALLDRRAPPFDLSEAERRLYGAYYGWALSFDDPVIRSLLQEQVDLANIKAALDLIRHRDPKQPAEPSKPIPGGRLSGRFLSRLVSSATLEEAFGVLDESYFASGIEKGILAYGESRSLGVMERFLEEMVIQAGCRLYRQDLLSIAVPVGYLWKKHNETVNLRALCRGRSARMPANAIRKELLLV
jgi:vacuolar-type H+-ATPase subunit C/Vma6